MKYPGTPNPDISQFNDARSIRANHVTFLITTAPLGSKQDGKAAIVLTKLHNERQRENYEVEKTTMKSIPTGPHFDRADLKWRTPGTLHCSSQHRSRDTNVNLSANESAFRKGHTYHRTHPLKGKCCAIDISKKSIRHAHRLQWSRKYSFS